MFFSLTTSIDEPTPEGRWTSGSSLDGRSEFSKREQVAPLAQKPSLAKARPHSGTQTEQQQATDRQEPIAASVAFAAGDAGINQVHA